MQLPPLRVQLEASKVPEPVEMNVSTVPEGVPKPVTVIVHVDWFPTATGLMQLITTVGVTWFITSENALLRALEA